MASAPRKALINSPATLVAESLQGLVAATPHLLLMEGFPQVRASVHALEPLPYSILKRGR